MIKALRLWWQGQARARDASPSQNANEGLGQPPGANTFQAATHDRPADAATPPDGTRHPAESALDALVQAWTERARTPGPPLNFLNADVVARLFAENLRSVITDRIGINSHWVRANYPLFCNSIHLDYCPPFKDFARELSNILPRIRQERLTNGRRESYTVYIINEIPFGVEPPPARQG
jgi:hypothetical protein